MTKKLLVGLDRGTAWLIDAAALVSSLLVVSLMLYLVVARYVFGWSIVGLLELIMMFAMWLYMLGALIASRRNEHLTVDIVAQKITDARLRAAHKVLIACGTLAAAVFFTYLASRMLSWGLKHPQTTPGLGLPLWLPQSAILVAGVGCVIYAARDIVRAVASLSRRGGER